MHTVIRLHRLPQSDPARAHANRMYRSVGEFQRHNDELLGFAVDDIRFEFVGDNQPPRKLVQETGLPKLRTIYG